MFFGISLLIIFLGLVVAVKLPKAVDVLKGADELLEKRHEERTSQHELY